MAGFSSPRKGLDQGTGVPDIATLSISSLSDYHPVDFPGKDLQREQVIDTLDQEGFIPEDLIEREVDWFYNMLGIDDICSSPRRPQHFWPI